jgi:membrane protease YdiL (CAAX protease family)
MNTPGLWARLPVLVSALLSGLAVALAGTVPWAVLVSANTRHLTSVPWAVPLMAVYLWLYWHYVRGAGWPRSTSAARRANSRANRLVGRTWGAALLAGILGLVTILLFQGVLGRLVSLPREQHMDFSRYPATTVFFSLLMSAVVAGMVEETAFRGYVQRPLERSYGPVLAILVTGTLFGFAHFTHPEVTLVLLPYYLAVAAVYGALAYFTDSTLPSMALHIGGNAFSALDFMTRGRSEWHLSVTPKPLIWQAGPDAPFWANLAAFVVVGAAAIWAYAALSRAAQATRAPVGDQEH